MSKKSKSSKSVKKPQPGKAKVAPKGKPLSEPMKAGLKAVAEKSGSKLSKVIALLSRPEGVTLDEIMKATAWQKHTVRGAMSGTLKKKHGYDVTSRQSSDGVRHYMIKSGAKTASK